MILYVIFKIKSSFISFYYASCCDMSYDSLLSQKKSIDERRSGGGNG